MYSVSAVRTLMSRYRIHPKKRWGQNFLIDGNSARKIIRALPLHNGCAIWEIGSGFGALTTLLSTCSTRLTLFEIDNGLVKYALAQWRSLKVIDDADRPCTSGYPRMFQGDAAKLLPLVLSHNTPPDILVGNLPYSCAAKLLICCACHDTPPHTIAVMVQREIAERMRASINSKNYSSFSVLMQSSYLCEREWPISRTVFYPIPNVDSVFIIATRRERANAQQMDALQRTVRCAFQSRRATMQKNLTQNAQCAPRYKEALRRGQEDGIFIQDIRRKRAENLTSEEFLRLSRILYPLR